MLIIGLTGSIATGKSTVSALLASPPYSLPIIDADLLARQVVEPGTPAYKAIVNYFGPSTPDLLLPPSDGDATSSQPPLNRPALGRRVFGTSEERKRDRMILNKIVHPAVRWEIYKALIYYYVRGHWAVVLDVPLLFESGMDLICGTVVVVGVRDPAVQMARLRSRDPHLSARGVIVWNDGDKADLEKEVSKAMEMIKASSPNWWAWVLLLAPPLGVGIAAWNLAVNFATQKSWQKKEREEKAKL